ncbi:MAGUK p55 subfamily member 3 isoform X6 [Opisthocomus hoazin]|uniref:MAGUK p55 subfamily member 3 isoform X6 n=1 Tax=Opisthocomus hoazin TaxID=30419 RepID=UPI003F53749B
MPVLSEDSGLHETLALLTSQLRPDSNHKEEVGFLRDVFSEKSLSYLMKIHEKLRHYERQSPTPVLHSAAGLVEDVIEELQTAPVNNEEKELLQLLSTPHLRAMLVVHDTVAQKNFDPVLPPLPDNFDDDFDEESVKIVRLVKNKEPLVFMRALFCYNPKEDRAIPCQEAGLPFKRRHVLEVVSQDDPTWWQAKRVGDTNLRAGLIPSKQFQERRLTYRRTIGTLQNPRTVKKPVYDQSSDKEDCDCEGYFNGEYIAGLRRSFRLSRKEKENNLNEGKQAEQTDAAEFLTYEEVTKYQQQPGEQQRLVVLIGCLGARLSELKQKVVSENPQEYGVAVPHTTRSKKSHEKEGVEYNFVSKQSFETDVQQNKFVEHGEYKENLYGTSLEAIRSVMAKKKVCLVDVVPEAVKHLRTPEFKPYVIFVKPFIPENKKHILKSPMSEEIPASLQDEEQQEIINSATFIEEQYGHLIDTVLVKEDLQSACNQLKTVLEKLNKDSFWVPVNWVRS